MAAEAGPEGRSIFQVMAGEAADDGLCVDEAKREALSSIVLLGCCEMTLAGQGEELTAAGGGSG